MKAPLVNSFLLFVGLVLLQSRSRALTFVHLYPFGTAAGDQTYSAADADGPVLFEGFSFPFYGQQRDTVAVASNGAVWFGGGNGSSERGPSDYADGGFPVQGPGYVMAAPFWTSSAHVQRGSVFYRRLLPAQSHLLFRARLEIESAGFAAGVVADGFDPTSLFIATWDDVGSGENATNTFQCVLATNGSHSFVLFLYVEDLMRWTGGPTTDQVLQTDSGTDGLASDNDDVDAEGEGGGEGPFAIIGFNAGDGVRSTSLPWSQTSQVLNVADYHNTANPENSIYNSGLWIYRVDEASVVVPSPEIHLTLDAVSPLVAREGDGSSMEVQVCATLTRPSEKTVALQVLANPMSAKDGEDFVLMEDELTFEPGMLHQCIAVRIVDDEILEATESFSLVFNNSKSLSVVLGLDTVTIEILDDDENKDYIASSVELTFEPEGSSSAKEEEGEGEGACLVIQVMDDKTYENDESLLVLMGSDDPRVMVLRDRAVVAILEDDGGRDYRPIKVEHRLTHGNEGFCVNVTVYDDAILEGTETFLVHLGSATARVEIMDDDGVSVYLEPASLSVSEGEGMVEACVVLNGLFERAVNVSLQPHATGSAKEGLDFDSSLLSVTFAVTDKEDSGSEFTNATTVRCTTVAIVDDSIVEDTENFTVELLTTDTSVVVVALEALPGKPPEATVTILDDDKLLVHLAKSLYHVQEGPQASVLICVNYTGEIETDQPLTVALTTENGSAFSGSDYIPAKEVFNITGAAGHPLCLGIVVMDDETLETYEERFYVLLQMAAARDQPVELAEPSRASVFIEDNDFVSISFEKGQFSVTEEEGEFDVCVALNGSLAVSVGVAIQASSLSAQPGEDYEPISTGELLLEFHPGSLHQTQCISLATVDDRTEEGDESFSLTLLTTGVPPNATRGVLLQPFATTHVTISDQDAYCPQETTDGYFGRYEWPVTYRGELVSFPCSSSSSSSSSGSSNKPDRESELLSGEKPRSNATRGCSGEGKWLPADFSSCEVVPERVFNASDPGSDVNFSCVSWDFEAADGRGNWTTSGCTTEPLGGSDSDDSNATVVVCRCSHLTNFGCLVDIRSRTEKGVSLSDGVDKVLSIISIVGVSASLISLLLTVLTMLYFRKIRKRESVKFRLQLCLAIMCFLLAFVIGFERTEVYGVCVGASLLIQYFALVSILWMWAEAVLMFQKLVLVFMKVTKRYQVIMSLVCWLAPLPFGIIPLAIDRDYLVTSNENGTLESCFISHVGVFFGAFLGPIFAVILMNLVIFFVVIGVLVKHSRKNIKRLERKKKVKATFRTLLSILAVMTPFGLTWFFAAFTVSKASVAFQFLFTITNTFQGFFIFLFFCVLSKDTRTLWWKELTCGRYQPKKEKRRRTGTLYTTVSRGSTLNRGMSSTYRSNTFNSSTFNSSTAEVSLHNGELSPTAGEEKAKEPLASTSVPLEEEKPTCTPESPEQGQEEAVECREEGTQSKADDTSSKCREEESSLSSKQPSPELETCDNDAVSQEKE